MTEKSLVKKLSEVMAEVGYVQKDATNAFHGYKYASAEAVLKKVNAALSSRQIAVSTQAELLRYENNHAVVRLSLSFTDGTDTLTAQGIGEGSDKGDKSVMKANTAATKYALADAFMISWGDDPEADASTDKQTADEARVADWLILCEDDSKAALSNGKRETFKKWWPSHKAEILSACGEAGAAQVYASFSAALKGMAVE